VSVSNRGKKSFLNLTAGGEDGQPFESDDGDGQEREVLHQVRDLPHPRKTQSHHLQVRNVFK